MLYRIKTILKKVVSAIQRRKYPHISKTTSISRNVHVYCPENLIMEEHTNIHSDSVIMNTRARYIVKKWSGSAMGLLVVTGNHMQLVGKSVSQLTDKDKDELDVNHELDRDVVVEEDVWIGSNVTLLAGATIGRGAIVGASCVVRSGKIPPYAVLSGNPAKIVGFRFTPEEIIKHEETLYPEDERLPLDLLEKNYEKYYLSRIKEIKSFLKL